MAKIGREQFAKIKNLPRQEIFAICEELLKSDYNEEAFIAADWAYRIHAAYEPGDLILFERWLNNYINNWAKCDTLCNHAIGSFYRTLFTIHLHP